MNSIVRSCHQLLAATWPSAWGYQSRRIVMSHCCPLVPPCRCWWSRPGYPVVLKQWAHCNDTIPPPSCTPRIHRARSNATPFDWIDGYLAPIYRCLVVYSQIFRNAIDESTTALVFRIRQSDRKTGNRSADREYAWTGLRYVVTWPVHRSASLLCGDAFKVLSITWNPVRNSGSVDW